MVPYQEHGLADVDEQGPGTVDGAEKHGPATVDGPPNVELRGLSVESDYEQEADDIAAETCVDSTKIWDGLNVPNRQHQECASGSDELNSLEGSDGEEDIFRKATRAHAVKHRCDVKFKKNDQHRIMAVCKSEVCNWKTTRQMIDGGVKDQYSKLMEYAAEVMRMNPDTTIILKCDDSGRFQRMYICLGALKQGDVGPL
ncbi:hypothetical protein LWI29_021049 [Acer saccharum]|uniref:Transposase MuDR plant domain-containing protein n=1 Tax=Acer saccharum TaxID=4024 RepID=A0AA39SY58_ACESA|nr:hypothetical protein LWI29_021049 [Acer saccharum]